MGGAYKPRTDAQRAHLAEYMRAYNKAHKEKLSAWKKERYKNDTNAQERQRVRYRTSEKLRSWHREYKIRKREEIKKYASDYWRSPEGKMTSKLRDKKYQSNPVNRMHTMVTAAFSRALKRDLPFDQCLRNILKSDPPLKCACCNVDLNFNTYDKGHSRQSPSLDRLEGCKGYVVGNAYVVCWRCNVLKRDGTLEEFENIVAYLKKYQGRKEIREEVNESAM